MKHLKTKEIFESLDINILDDVRDICSELVEVWYEWYHIALFKSIVFVTAKTGTEYTLILSRAKDSDIQYQNDAGYDAETNRTLYYTMFKYGEAEEVVNRLEDYLGDKLRDICFFDGSTGNAGGWTNIKTPFVKDGRTLSDRKTDGIKIRFII